MLFLLCIIIFVIFCLYCGIITCSSRWRIHYNLFAWYFFQRVVWYYTANSKLGQLNHNSLILFYYVFIALDTTPFTPTADTIISKPIPALTIHIFITFLNISSGEVGWQVIYLILNWWNAILGQNNIFSKLWVMYFQYFFTSVCTVVP